MLARIEQLTASYKNLGWTLRGGNIRCNPVLLELLERSDLPGNWVAVLDADLAANTYLLEPDIGRTSHFLQTVTGFALEEILTEEEVLLRWMLQETDGMSAADASEAARILL